MDSDQSLAAKPGFHSDPPGGGGCEVMAILRFSDYRSALGEQQPENGMALVFGPAHALGVVLKDGAGGAAVEAAAGAVIEIMDGHFDRQGEVVRHCDGGIQPLIQGGLKVADAFFHAAIVAGKVGRIVQGQDAEAAHDFIHGAMVERRTGRPGTVLRSPDAAACGYSI